MPLNILFEVVIAIIEILRMALLTAIPCFVVALAGEQLHSRLSKRFSLSWAKSTLISTYLIITLLITLLYLILLYLAWVESPLSWQQVPPELQSVPADIAVFLFFTALRILLSALVYSILLLPFLFFAVYILDKLREMESKLPEPANKFIAVFASSFLAWIILLFIFPWVWGGLIYLLFWG